MSWLVTGAAMVATMVLLGGMTRLTHSGLSMTEWNLIMDAVPPLTDSDWEVAFEKYRQFPEYRRINSHFVLDDFKGIYLWEYLHRLVGRLIGLVFLIPFLIFLARGSLRGRLLYGCLILFALGAFQGFLGWYMVRSGLVDRPWVSHYRLAAHLCAAFITLAYLIWLLLTLQWPHRPAPASCGTTILVRVLLVCAGVQIVLGALVAGLRAGLVFPTWPKMGAHWVPPSLAHAMGQGGMTGLLAQPVAVQFMHRSLAYLVVALALALWLQVRATDGAGLRWVAACWAAGVALLQFTTGVFTILLHVPVWLGAVHQFLALVLLAAATALLYATPWQWTGTAGAHPG